MNNIRDFVLIDPVANQVKNLLDFCENFFYCGVVKND